MVLSDDSGRAACLYYHNNPIGTREFSQVELDVYKRQVECRKSHIKEKIHTSLLQDVRQAVS